MRKRRREERDEARRLLLEAEVERFRSVLSARADVVRVVLFGSAARDRVSARSDLDLIIVQRTGLRFLDRLDEMYRLLVPRVACDILVYTPEEYERLSGESRLVMRANREGKVLYAA
jgi:predicted nucleotidyltransferase